MFKITHARINSISGLGQEVYALCDRTGVILGYIGYRDDQRVCHFITPIPIDYMAPLSEFLANQLVARRQPLLN